MNKLAPDWFLVRANLACGGQVRHKPVCARSKFVYRSCRGNVQGSEIRISPGKIRWLFRHNDRSKVMSLGVPYPDSLRTRDVKIPIAIDLDSIGDAVALTARLFTEDAAVGDRAIGTKIINANVSLLAVVNVEFLAVGRKGQAVGLAEFLGEQSDFAAGVEPEDTLIGEFLLFSIHQVECRIGEVQRVIGAENNVVGAVEFLSFEAIRKDCVFSIGRKADDRAQHAGSINQPMLLVVGVAVRISE